MGRWSLVIGHWGTAEAATSYFLLLTSHFESEDAQRHPKFFIFHFSFFIPETVFLMRLETLLAVTGGKLLNTPAISRFDSVALKPERVERGALYVTQNPATVEDALARGAYGILCTRACELLDDESAWIVAPDYRKALVGILRAWLAEHPRRFFHLPYNVFHFARQLGRQTPLKWLDGEIDSVAEAILRSDPDDRLVVWDGRFLNLLGVDPVPLSDRRSDSKIVKSGLFELSAIIDGLYYERLNVAPCLFEAFLNALTFLRNFETTLSIRQIGPVPSFSPIFLSCAGRIVNEGGSERVVVLTNGHTPCSCFEALEKVKWSRTIHFFPNDFKPTCAIKSPINRFKNGHELAKMVMKALQKPGFYTVFEEKENDLIRLLSPARPQPIQKGLF